jgi:hypothetical protein
MSENSSDSSIDEFILEFNKNIERVKAQTSSKLKKSEEEISRQKRFLCLRMKLKTWKKITKV